MDAKTSADEPNDHDNTDNGRMAHEKGSKLERVMSFWGSYCFADVSSWTEEEIKSLSDSLETTPEPSRRQQQSHRVHRALGGYPEDQP